MRTTLTLDPDVAARLSEARQERGRSLRDVVNEALRLGLRAMEEPDPAPEPYRTPASSLGGCRLPDVDDIPAALARAEGETFR